MVLAAPPQCGGSSVIGGSTDLLARLLPRWWSVASHLEGGISLDLPHPRLLFTDASDSGWGASLGEDRLSGLWSQDVLKFSINHCELLAILLVIRGFLHLLRDQSVSLFTDNMAALAYLHKEGGMRSFSLNAVAQATLRLCEANAVHLPPPPPPPPRFVSGLLNILADSLSRGSEWTLCQEVCQELFCHWPVNIDLFATSLNTPSSGLFFANGGSTVSGECHFALNLGQPRTLHVFSIRLHSACPHQGSPVSEPRVDLSGSLLVPEAMVPGSLGAPSGCAGPSAYTEGSTQTTPLPSLPLEPPHTTINWRLYCEQSARHLGFSARVACQLTLCRRSSTRVNYQAKWVTYCTWCCTHDHSISHPSDSKIADFLLYLRRSLHLSYSFMASYRSMLSAAFRFVLPEISSHPVHDLLRSFWIECPLPSSRAPP